MDTGFVLSKLAVVFAAIAVGFLTAKCKVFNHGTAATLSKIIIYLFNPALILQSAMTGERILSYGKVFALTGVALACYAFLIATSFLIPKLLRLPREKARTYRFMYIFSNIGFFGLPVITSLYGEQSAFLTVVFLVPFQILVFSYGVTLISPPGENQKIKARMFLHPMIVASVVTYLIYLSGVTFPAAIRGAVGFLAQGASPSAMIVVGFVLAEAPLGKVFGDWRKYGLILIKMVLVPTLVLLILRQFFPHSEQNDLILAVSTMIMCMPIATNTAILATQYGGDTETAASSIFLSTAFSAVTIPFFVWLLQTL